MIINQKILLPGSWGGTIPYRFLASGRERSGATDVAPAVPLEGLQQRAG